MVVNSLSADVRTLSACQPDDRNLSSILSIDSIKLINNSKEKNVRDEPGLFTNERIVKASRVKKNFSISSVFEG